jgi:hypothetical protein
VPVVFAFAHDIRDVHTVAGSVSFDIRTGHCHEQQLDSPLADGNRSSAGPEPVPPRDSRPEPLGAPDVEHHDGHSRCEWLPRHVAALVIAAGRTIG